jgi:hypothetical protein
MSRPQFAPTDEQRRAVKEMACHGVPQDDIALVIDIAPKTLRLHFRRELDLGSAEANNEVGRSLYKMATSGTNVAAAIFWMKARAGWREVQVHEVAGKDGGPVQFETIRRVIVDPGNTDT